MRTALALALVLPLAGGCGGGAGELECQRRIVGALDWLQTRPDGLTGAFTAARDRLQALSTEGCSEDQENDISAMTRLSGRMAAASGRVDEARPGLRPEPSPRTRAAFTELMAVVEQFERRRLALKQELERMERDGG